MLKIISNILRPTSGSVKVNGKITSFLEQGGAEKTKIVHGNVTGVEFLGFHFNGMWKG